MEKMDICCDRYQSSKNQLEEVENQLRRFQERNPYLFLSNDLSNLNQQISNNQLERDELEEKINAINRFVKEKNSANSKNEMLLVYLSEPMEASEMNKLLFNKGITLSHLVKRKESLEEQFLELTKQN